MNWLNKQECRQEETWKQNLEKSDKGQKKLWNPNASAGKLKQEKKPEKSDKGQEKLWNPNASAGKPEQEKKPKKNLARIQNGGNAERLWRKIGCRLTAETAAGFVLLFCVGLMARYVGLAAAGNSVHLGSKAPLVCVDVGHGGNDPGKVGVDGSLEKEVNLAIAQKLKTYLEQSDVRVMLTREEDRGLYKESDSGKKAADMRNRCAMIDEANPELVVSIHQNSYHQEEISGGQVFYYKTSEKGKKLAEILQKRFDYVLGEKNRRLAKPNDSYYLLLHVKCPIVIVECGFLSNRAEAARLNTPEYQERLAWTIHMGIMEYLNQR